MQRNQTDLFIESELANRFYNKPSLLESSALNALSCAPQKMYDAPWEGYEGGGLSVCNGVAVLDIVGPLVFKMSWWGSSYDMMSEQLHRLESREDVKALMLNIHSPGGEVAGCFDLVDQIFALRESMPVVAVSSDTACSAAYAIASAASEHAVSQTARVGSIGVLMAHRDISGMLDENGVTVTEIFAGQNKTLGTPYKQLSASDRVKLQESVNATYDLFVGKVSRNREKLSEDAIRETEAAVFRAEDAIEVGLADRIASGRDILQELQEVVSSMGTAQFTQTPQETHMSTPDNAATVTITQAEYEERLAAAREEGHQLGLAEGNEAAQAAETGTSEAITNERARIQAIVGSDSAANRQDLAQHIAFETSMTADEAVAMLDKSPEQKGGSLSSQMNGYQPGIGGSDGGDEQANDNVLVNLAKARAK